jgi:hypothetical protein
MPGGSPTFPTAQSIDILYEHLERLFARAAGSVQGATLAEFHDVVRETRPADPGPRDRAGATA